MGKKGKQLQVPIRISKNVRAKLKKSKNHPRETYNQTLNRLLKNKK